jgi:hypothetical protein
MVRYNKCYSTVFNLISFNILSERNCFYLEFDRQSLEQLPASCFRGDSCSTATGGSFATRSNTSDSGSGGNLAGDAVVSSLM